MKKMAVLTMLILLMSISMFSTTGVSAQATEKVPVIISFHGALDADLVKAFGGTVKYEYAIIPAIAASLPAQAIDALQKNPKIALIEPDAIAHATVETLGWGVERIGAPIVHQDNTGVGVKVAIVDTGIDYTHPDLAANYMGGKDFVNNDDDPMDDNGHGTHCAGIVAAVDNEIGVIGVAPGASLYAAKVLDASGSGSYSTIIAGIDWAVTQGVHIISMSLGGDSGLSSFENACNNAYSAGVLVVAAAGNDYKGNSRIEWDTVDYPARYSSVIAVGATDSNNIKASFSSTGPAVELAAPGVSIFSTYLGGYATASGTSMACPHVAGAAALVFASPANPGDTDGWQASEVRAKLTATADDLGAAGFDYWYGYGLVDADEAASADTVADTTPPAITNLTPADGTTVTIDTPTISATITDASGIGTFTMTLDGLLVAATYSEAESKVTYTPTNPLADGTHPVTLTVSDTNGNTATTAWSFTVSTQTPPPPIETPTASVTVVLNPEKIAGKNLFISASATVTVTGSSGPISGATVNGHWSDATTDTDSALTDVNGVVTLSSNELKNPLTATFVFTVDSIVIGGQIYPQTAVAGQVAYP